MTTERNVPATEAQDLVVTHVFAAPRDVVWKALTECEHLRHWWGPQGFTMHTCRLDLRPGGVFHYGLRSRGGDDMWGKFVFREIVAPERLVFTTSFADKAGKTVRAPFSRDWPLEVLSTWTLTGRDGETTLTLRSIPIAATDAERAAFASMFASMQAGFAGAFDQLDAYLTTMEMPTTDSRGS